MRRLAAIPLLLVLLSAASGALPAVCASQCALAMPPQHASSSTPVPETAMLASGHHNDHHAAQPAAAPAQVSGGATQHCVTSAQPAAATRALPQVQLAAASPVAVVAEVGLVAAPVATVLSSATSPGPPVLAAPLRI
jgi:hypothetical protein